MPGATEEADEGWVFFYNTIDYLRSGDPLDGLAGNGPLFVTREGTLKLLSSAFPWEEALQST